MKLSYRCIFFIIHQLVTDRLNTDYNFECNQLSSLFVVNEVRINAVTSESAEFLTRNYDTRSFEGRLS